MATRKNSGDFRKDISVDAMITEQEGLVVVKPETRRVRKTTLPNSADLPKSVRKEIAKKGAKTLNDKRKEAKTFAEAFSMLADIVLNLESDQDAIQLLSQHGIKPTERQIIAFNQIQMAKRDTKSFMAVRDTMGEKPVEKQEVELQTRNIDEIYNRWQDEIQH